jgi:hypothetical protein
VAKKNMPPTEAWRKLIQQYSIPDKVSDSGSVILTADDIREYREPRLMAKWDSEDYLPQPLKSEHLNILPVSRSAYIVSDVLLYEPLPSLDQPVKEMTQVRLPHFESIDIEHISSESNAINALKLSGILDDFLGEKTVETFNGRMGSGEFGFNINRFGGGALQVDVQNAQLEIDGGFETDNSVVVMEAKNVPHDDFLVRQLYYPYRLWSDRVEKPVRLVFSQYTNQIFRLFEYGFSSQNDYSSIKLLNAKNYSLQDTTITLEDIHATLVKTCIKTDDKMDGNSVPFIQANSMDRVIAILEHLALQDMNMQEIAESMEFAPRQSTYYTDAGIYLGLFYRPKPAVISLTNRGRQIFKMRYQDRQLALVSQIFEHQIFQDFFIDIYRLGKFPEREEIEEWMRKNNVCNERLIVRRASTVLSWLTWMVSLTETSDEE